MKFSTTQNPRMKLLFTTQNKRNILGGSAINPQFLTKFIPCVNFYLNPSLDRVWLGNNGNFYLTPPPPQSLTGLGAKKAISVGDANKNSLKSQQKAISVGGQIKIP